MRCSVRGVVYDTDTNVKNEGERVWKQGSDLDVKEQGSECRVWKRKKVKSHRFRFGMTNAARASSADESSGQAPTEVAMYPHGRAVATLRPHDFPQPFLKDAQHRMCLFTNDRPLQRSTTPFLRQRPLPWSPQWWPPRSSPQDPGPHHRHRQAELRQQPYRQRSAGTIGQYAGGRPKNPVRADSRYQEGAL